MKQIKLCISHRCFFPKGAFYYSTEKIAKLAKEVGYDGVEFLPTWRFVWEMKWYGKLLAPKEMVVSGHRDWRFDGIMDARLKNKNFWSGQIKERAFSVFPASNICLSALKQFQKAYQVPVSVAWLSDTENFSPVMLELWGTRQGIDQKELMNWLRKNPKNKGVVIDTAKFGKWLESNRLLKEKKGILNQLIPHIFEIHYRQVNQGNKWELAKLKEIKEILRYVLKQGYRGRIVVEFGWPDLDDSPFGLFREDLEVFKKLHRNIFTFIQNI